MALKGEVVSIRINQAGIQQERPTAGVRWGARNVSLSMRLRSPFTIRRRSTYGHRDHKSDTVKHVCPTTD